VRPVLYKLKKHTDTTVSELDGCRDGAVVWVGARNFCPAQHNPQGDVMAMLQLDDTRGLAEVMVFPGLRQVRRMRP
jgi:DNA polymerase-3 subunit alpha